MFDTITIDQAAADRWDVVIAGSSFSAMFFLRGLRPDLRVLVIERGGLRSHAQILRDGHVANQAFAMENASGAEKTWTSKITFGANSNCWWAQMPRFHPSDFRLHTLYGQGADWPIGYDALEPYYARVEAIMEVAGGAPHLLPRSAPFPYPAHAVARSDAVCMKARPDIWTPTPTARSNGGSRAPCCANGVCDRCPVDAKFIILNAMDQFVRPGAALLLETELRQVDMAGGVATGVTVVDAGGAERRIGCGAVALATNAINNAAILLRSGRSDPALGRYLHEQVGRNVLVDTPFPGYFGGTSITALCYGHYDGPHRNDDAAVLIESTNTTASIRPERGKWTHRMRLKLVAEDLPQPQNRVTLDDAGEVVIHWLGHSDYARRGLARAEARLCDVLPDGCQPLPETRDAVTEQHIQGTHRMGRDPETSVVDSALRLHGSENVFALGAGAFTSCSPANPTLTLSALALRAGETL